MHFQEKPTRGRGWFLGVSATICASYFVFSFALNAFADPPGSPYAPGSTLNPSCAPTSTNCTVYPPLFSTSTLPTNGVLFVSDASGTVSANASQLSFTSSTGFFGVGTSSPISLFSVAGSPPQTSTSTLVLLGNSFITGGNPSGTFLGANVTSSFNGDFLNFEVNSTSLFQVGSGTVKIDSGTFFVDAQSNRVGIGTVQPSSTFHVIGSFTQSGGAAALATSTITGSLNIDEGGSTSSNIFATGVPTQDLFHIANASATGVNTAGVNALSVSYVGGAGTGGIEAAAQRIDFAPGASGTWSGIRIVGNSSTIAGVFENAIKVDPLATPGPGAETAIQIGGGWDTALAILGGVVQNTNTPLFALGSSTQGLASASGTFIGINTALGFNGDFLDFQNNSSTKFRVASSGFVSITATAGGGLAIATTTMFGATTTLTVCARSNCTVPATASATNAVAFFASTNGTTAGVSIVARGVITSGLTDIGEYITVAGADSDYTAGELISVDNNASGTFSPSSGAYDPDLAGVITVTAGLIAGGGQDTHGSNVIALAGRVPVNVTGKNGPIAIGDYITSSDIPGYGMKANQPGRVIGIAMDSFSGTTANDTGTVLTFVNPHWTLGNATSGTDIGDSGWNLVNTSGTIGASPVDQFTAYVAAALAKLGVVIQNGVATLKAIVVDKVTTNLLCVQNVCITGSQLGNLLQNAGTPTTPPPPPPATPSPTQSSTDSGFVVASDTTTSDVTTTEAIVPDVTNTDNTSSSSSSSAATDANASGTTN